MKKSPLLASLLFFSFASNAQHLPFQNDLEKIARDEQEANRGKIAPPSTMQLITDYDVKYHRCEWKCDPAIKYISGKITTYFKPVTAGFDSICFNLSDSLTVDSIKYHNNQMAFLHSNGLITIILPAVIPINILDSIAVFYKGIPPNTGFGSFSQTFHNSVPNIWTLSEPYGASDWWPCKNSLTDKADSVDIIVTTPIGDRVGSNGLLVSETTSGPNKIFYWKHRYPIATYLICFSTTNYVHYSDFVPFNSTNLEVLNYVYPEDSASIVPQTADIIPVMQLYDTLFGIYPFVNEKYGHAECGFGGGMEHQTMTFVGNFSHEIIAHELAHHWFGDKITCASWTDIWLNEGFAVYLSGLTYEHMFNGIYWMPFKRMRINNICTQPGGSVWVDDTTTVSRIFDPRLSYAKGAMVLHQLRWVIGDSAFFAALNNYLTDPALAYGFAHTSDLKAHFEASANQNLSWYFNDWFTGQGFPSYQISWDQIGNTVNLTVNQTQSHISVPFFELPLPIELKDATHDTIIRLNNTFSGQTFSVNLPFTVDSVKFDPTLWIISSNNIVSGIQESEMAQQINVFPNPAHDKIQISFSKPFIKMSVKLLDLTGRIISTTAADDQKNISLDVSTVARGYYFLRFSSEGRTTNKKIVIE